MSLGHPGLEYRKPSAPDIKGSGGMVFLGDPHPEEILFSLSCSQGRILQRKEAGETPLEFLLFFHCHLLTMLPVGQNTGLGVWVITVFTGQQRLRQRSTEKELGQIETMSDIMWNGYYLSPAYRWGNEGTESWKSQVVGHWHGSTSPWRPSSSSLVSCFMRHMAPSLNHAFLRVAFRDR